MADPRAQEVDSTPKTTPESTQSSTAFFEDYMKSLSITPSTPTEKKFDGAAELKAVQADFKAIDGAGAGTVDGRLSKEELAYSLNCKAQELKNPSAAEAILKNFDVVVNAQQDRSLLEIFNGTPDAGISMGDLTAADGKALKSFPKAPEKLSPGSFAGLAKTEKLVSERLEQASKDGSIKPETISEAKAMASALLHGDMNALNALVQNSKDLSAVAPVVETALDKSGVRLKVSSDNKRVSLSGPSTSAEVSLGGSEPYTAGMYGHNVKDAFNKISDGTRNLATNLEMQAAHEAAIKVVKENINQQIKSVGLDSDQEKVLQLLFNGMIDGHNSYAVNQWLGLTNRMKSEERKAILDGFGKVMEQNGLPTDVIRTPGGSAIQIQTSDGKHALTFSTAPGSRPIGGQDIGQERAPDKEYRAVMQQLLTNAYKMKVTEKK